MKTFKQILTGVGCWLLHLTWGLLDTIYGFVLFLVFVGKAKEIKYIHHKIVLYIDWSYDGWGLEGGLFIFSTEPEILDSRSHMFKHEYGHCVPQTLVFGPLHPFICVIPSAIRFWWREKHSTMTAYDDFWVEGTASKWGTKWVEHLDSWYNKKESAK